MGVKNWRVHVFNMGGGINKIYQPFLRNILLGAIEQKQQSMIIPNVIAPPPQKKRIIH